MRKRIAWYAILAASLILSASAAAQCPSSRTAKLFLSKQDFYNGTTPGTLALMPNATREDLAKIENRYLAFTESGTYTVKRSVAKSPLWWLVINHQQTSGEPTYIGILVLKVFEYQMAHPVELVRTGDWIRSKESVPIPVREQFRWLDDFVRLQSDEATLASFDQRFLKWHAIPKGGKQLSWDFRTEWNISVSNAMNDIKKVTNGQPQSAHVLLQARLMRYEMTNTWNTSKPLVWNMSTSGPRALLVKTFSPAGSEFARQYCIVLEE